MLTEGLLEAWGKLNQVATQLQVTQAANMSTTMKALEQSRLAFDEMLMREARRDSSIGEEVLSSWDSFRSLSMKALVTQPAAFSQVMSDLEIARKEFDRVFSAEYRKS